MGDVKDDDGGKVSKNIPAGLFDNSDDEKEMQAELAQSQRVTEGAGFKPPPLPNIAAKP